MDPNEALKEIRKLISNEDVLWRDDVDRLVTLIEGLDAWITKGGFLPDAWRP